MTEGQQAALLISAIGSLYGAIYGCVGFAGVIQRINCPQMTVTDYFHFRVMEIAGFVVFSISMIGPLCLLR